MPKEGERADSEKGYDIKGIKIITIPNCQDGYQSQCQYFDPSTALKPRSEERGKKSRSGSTLSMPRAEARGSRRVD